MDRVVRERQFPLILEVLEDQLIVNTLKAKARIA